MLTKVEVRNSQGNTLSLPLSDTSSGLIVKEIEGLDPVKATLVSSSFARLNGEQYQSSRREPRNVKFKLAFSPNAYSVADLRKQLYQFFMPQSEVLLQFFMTDNPSVVILGRVETFEAPLFTKDPEVNISMMCFNPDFVDPSPVSLSMTSMDAITDTLVSYAGSVETGLRFTFNIDRAIAGFTIYHRLSDNNYHAMEFSADLLAGDLLEISTISGAKGATLTRAGTEQSILYGVAPQANWIELMPGDNYLLVYLEGVGIPFTVEYTTKYGGL